MVYSRKNGRVSGPFFGIFGGGVRVQGQTMDGKVRGWVCMAKKEVFWLLSYFENSTLNGKQLSYDHHN